MGDRKLERGDVDVDDPAAEEGPGYDDRERGGRHQRAQAPLVTRHRPHLSRPRSSGVRFPGESSGIVVNMTSVAAAANITFPAAGRGWRRLIPAPPSPTFARRLKHLAVHATISSRY